MFDELEPLDASDEPLAKAALGALADDANRNATLGRARGGVPVARRLDAHRRGAVLVGPQVERGDASTGTARG